MFKFFRKIRQKLVTENKFRKYLLYAAGEILLVMVGILLALQVNNWNGKRIDREKENLYLRNIERDLKDQLLTIELQIEFETEISSIATPIIEYYKKHQSFKIDSLFSANIGNLTGRKTFIRNEPGYTELLFSGNIDIISDNKLKDEIIKYYKELERIELVINKNNNLFVDEVFIPLMIGLTEIQISHIREVKVGMVDLNEKSLKRISAGILNNPENELKLVNSINYRNLISIVHLSNLSELKEKTMKLLNQLEGK